METVSENIMYKHTIIKIDNKCLDLLLTDQEIQIAFERALHSDYDKYINKDICCKCWPIDTGTECCPFWKSIFGLCEHCDEKSKSSESNCDN